jgi:hypothetical protein
LETSYQRAIWSLREDCRTVMATAKHMPLTGATMVAVAGIMVSDSPHPTGLAKRVAKRLAKRVRYAASLSAPLNPRNSAG